MNEKRNEEKRLRGLSALCMLLAFVGLVYYLSLSASDRKSEEYRYTKSKEDTGPALLISRFGITDIQYSIVYIEGSAQARRDCSYASVSFVIFNKSGDVVGNALDNISGLQKGNVWKFKALGTVNENGSQSDFRARIADVICF